jgi:hypothetical protein
MCAAAARLYADAFAADPKLMEDIATGRRYNAACSAALASSGQGKDAGTLGPEERGQLRQQAFHWLRADLEFWSTTLDEDKANGHIKVLRAMRHWRQDSDLASVRDREALAVLPAAQRLLWERLWSDVATLLARAEKRK